MKIFWKNLFLIIAVFILFFTINFSNLPVVYGQDAASPDPIPDPVAEFTKIINDYKDTKDPKHNKTNNWIPRHNDDAVQVIHRVLDDTLEGFIKHFNSISSDTDSSNTTKYIAASYIALQILEKEISDLENNIPIISLTEFIPRFDPDFFTDSVIPYLQDEVYTPLSEEIKKLDKKNQAGDVAGARTVMEDGERTRDENLADAKNASEMVPCQSLYQAVTSADCNAVLGIISGLISIINSLAVQLMTVAAHLFNVAMNVGIYNFSGWVDGIYPVWKTILTLITSLVLPFILYLLIRQIINNDESFKKAMGPILATAVLVYFSYPIAAFIIDQANIITIYIYRAITGGGATTLAADIKSLLDPLGSQAKTSSADLIYNLGQLIVNLASFFILLQAAVLMIFRAIMLVLGLVFSPIMIIPETGLALLDKKKTEIREMFINNIIMAPIFVFLMGLSIKIGAAVTGKDGGAGMLGAFNQLNSGSTQIDGIQSLIGSVLVIALLQIAITTAKHLAGEFSNKATSWVSKWSGKQTFGRTSRGLKYIRDKAINTEPGKWVLGAPGGARHEFLNKQFEKFGNIGQGEALSLKNLQNKFTSEYNPEAAEREKLNERWKYAQALNQEEKARLKARLENPGMFTEINETFLGGGNTVRKGLLDRLGGKFEKFDYNSEAWKSALNQADENTRMTEVIKHLDKEAEQFGGKNNFGEHLKDNAETKKEFEKAVNLKNVKERKKATEKIANDVHKEMNKKHGSKQETEKEKVATNTETQNQNNQKTGETNNQTRQSGTTNTETQNQNKTSDTTTKENTHVNPEQNTKEEKGSQNTKKEEDDYQYIHKPTAEDISKYGKIREFVSNVQKNQ